MHGVGREFVTVPAAAVAAAPALLLLSGVCMRDDKGNVFVVFRWDACVH
jgi:hypothetical protein